MVYPRVTELEKLGGELADEFHGLNPLDHALDAACMELVLMHIRVSELEAQLKELAKSSSFGMTRGQFASLTGDTGDGRGR